MRARPVVVVLSFVVAALTAAPAPAEAAADPNRADVLPHLAARRRGSVPAVRRPHARPYLPPVDAPVRDPFRPPACAWCAGNRGLEYDTEPGQAVRASAGGTVTFAGQVAGRLWVVVAHADGLRTSYGLVTAVEVRVGQVVAAGQRIAAAGEAVHFGLRRGDVYLDPALLLGGAALAPRLVPLDGAGARWPRA